MKQTDSYSDAHQFYRESEVMDEKEEYKLHPPIYSIWKYKVHVSYPFRCYAHDVLNCMFYSAEIVILGCEFMYLGRNL